VLEKRVIKVLTTKVCITSGGLHGEDTAANVEERNIEGSPSKIEDEDVFLSLGLTVKTVGNGCSSGLVDDTENIKARNGTGILGRETLRVVEIGRDTGEIDFDNGYGIKEKVTHVTTAFLTVLPSLASEISFILVRTIAEIS
jgi:hypothetical protein